MYWRQLELCVQERISELESIIIESPVGEREQAPDWSVESPIKSKISPGFSISSSKYKTNQKGNLMTPMNARQFVILISRPSFFFIYFPGSNEYR